MSFILAFAFSLFRAEAAAPSTQRPNVLLISVDDLKPILGCYGNETIQSPNIDRLARRGMLFERAYCNQAVCAPSRNALLTGMRPDSMGIYDLGTHFRRAVPDAITLPQLFKNSGYRAEGLGKIFHIGHGNHGDPASWSVPHEPAKVVAYVQPESGAREGLTREEALFANKSARGLPRGAAYEAPDVPDDAYPDGQLALEAIQRLRHASEHPDQPFFLAVGFVKPHLPFCAPKKYWDLYDRDAFELPTLRRPPEGAPPYAPQSGGEIRQYTPVPQRGPLPEDLQRALIHGYHAAISYMDAQVGRVLDELDRLGLAENTIVVLWGDHGYHLGDHGMWCKHTNYEQAARIPIIIAAPGITQPGTRSETPVQTVDLYPTLRELAGLSTGVPQKLDGASLVPILKGGTLPDREGVIHVYPRSPRGKGWILGRALRTERYRLVEWKKPGAAPETADLELYDYQTDPAETKNLAESRPEVVARLREILSRQPEAKPRFRR